MSWERAKDITLDYSLHGGETDFAKHRGFEPLIAQSQDLARRQKAFEIHVDESQISQYEELFREGAKAYDELGEKFISRNKDDDFSEFKREFERKHLELASALADRVKALDRRSSSTETLDQLLMEYIDMELVQDANLMGKYRVKERWVKGLSVREKP